MKLYKIKALYLGKDLDDTLTIGYFIANNDKEALLYIDKYYAFWIDTAFDQEDYDWDSDETEPEIDDLFNSGLIKRILDNKGDFTEEYDGEFYDIKYSWEEVGEITKDEEAVLRRFKIL